MTTYDSSTWRFQPKERKHPYFVGRRPRPLNPPITTRRVSYDAHVEKEEEAERRIARAIKDEVKEQKRLSRIARRKRNKGKRALSSTRVSKLKKYKPRFLELSEVS